MIWGLDADLEPRRYIDQGGKITANGKRAAKLPVHCVWYNAFFAGFKHNCLDQITTIAALLSTQDDILMRPHVVRYAADVKRSSFGHPASDHIARLNAMAFYVKARLQLGGNLAGWCNKYMINQRVAEQVLKTQTELLSHVKTNLLDSRDIPTLDDDHEEFDARIRKSLLAGFFFNVGIHHNKDGYKTVHDNHQVALDPDGCMVSMEWEWVIYHRMHYAGIQYLQICTAVEREWLVVCSLLI